MIADVDAEKFDPWIEISTARASLVLQHCNNPLPPLPPFTVDMGKKTATAAAPAKPVKKAKSKPTAAPAPAAAANGKAAKKEVSSIPQPRLIVFCL